MRLEGERVVVLVEERRGDWVYRGIFLGVSVECVCGGYGEGECECKGDRLDGGALWNLKRSTKARRLQRRRRLREVKLADGSVS